MDKDILLILILTNLSTLGLFLAVFYRLKREERAEKTVNDIKLRQERRRIGKQNGKDF